MVIVNPIPSPAIALNVPPGSAAVAKITQTRKNVSTSSMTTPCQTPDAAPARVAEVRGFAHVRRVEPAQQCGSGCGGREPQAPVDDRERGHDSASDEEAERHRGIEVPTGDVADCRDHYSDRQAVRQRDPTRATPL